MPNSIPVEVAILLILLGAGMTWRATKEPSIFRRAALALSAVSAITAAITLRFPWQPGSLPTLAWAGFLGLALVFELIDLGSIAYQKARRKDSTA